MKLPAILASLTLPSLSIIQVKVSSTFDFCKVEVLPASCCFSSKTFLGLGNLRASSILLSTFERLSLGFVSTRRCFGSEKPASSLFSHFAQRSIARYAPLFYAMPPCSVGIAFGTAIESHWLSSCTATCLAIQSKSQEMNL